ncbi:MAG: T9SS type A sorting domain-containing protein [Saprospiraceae bacterium]|nr:T9SS type A sorting domain-containing protein [Saprospiraceae bacterium]
MKNILLNKHRLLITAFILAFSGLYAQPPARIILNGAFINITEGAHLVIENPAADAITRISGSIISEGEFNNLRWNIGISTGNYEVPWGTTTNYFPLLFTPSAAVGDGHFIFSTYPTPWNNSSDLPTGIIQVNNAGGADNSAYLIDRFWRIEARDYTSKPILSNLVFTYLDAEHLASGNTINENNLKAQRYNDIEMTWADYPPTGTVNTANNTLTVTSVASDDLFPWWTLVDASSALPISLIAFTAVPEGQCVRLNWVTATEQNNDYFTIEKSLNGVVFQEVVEVDGAGNSSSEIKYKALDCDPWPGVSYYRLMQTDFDGNKSFSPIVSVTMGQSAEFTIHPNPTNGSDLTLDFTIIKSENIQVKVFSQDGKVMFDKLIPVTNNENFSTTIVLPDAIPMGIYFIQIDDDHTTYTKKFMLSQN